MSMPTPELHVVTGAFGFTGRYIARKLLAQGKRVRTLLSHPNRPDPFGGQVEAMPLNFDDLGALAESLRGAAVLYMTYWIRFPFGGAHFEKVVENIEALLRAAKEAEVRRILYISVSNPSLDSPLPYFRGKALAEQAVIHSELSYAIIRPTLIFGREDILINNIAWLLRRFPVFAIPGAGDYRVQPVFVEDVAEISVRAAEQRENIIVDAVGPEVYTFAEFVRLIAQEVGSRTRLVHVPPALALLGVRLLGYLVNDVVLTREELAGLMQNLLVTESPPTGQTRFSQWLAQKADQVGTRYASELERHFR